MVAPLPLVQGGGHPPLTVVRTGRFLPSANHQAENFAPKLGRKCHFGHFLGQKCQKMKNNKMKMQMNANKHFP